jgi:hypothetical protein
MSAVILYRTDRPKNMHRFYRLDVQPDLFGNWCFMRECGMGTHWNNGAGALHPLRYPGRGTSRAL